MIIRYTLCVTLCETCKAFIYQCWVHLFEKNDPNFRCIFSCFFFFLTKPSDLIWIFASSDNKLSYLCWTVCACVWMANKPSQFSKGIFFSSSPWYPRVQIKQPSPDPVFECAVGMGAVLPMPWWWYSMEVMPSNLKPSKRYSSIHQRRFDNRNRNTSQLARTRTETHTETHTQGQINNKLWIIHTAHHAL